MLTPETLEASYNLLKTTKPFSGWKLPDSEDIVFIVYKKLGHDGELAINNSVITIAINGNNSSLASVLKVVAHEMVHLRQYQLGRRKLTHGKEFKKLAAKVCAIQCWEASNF